MNFSSGVESQKDNIAIQLNEKVIQKIVDDFSNLSQVQLVQKYDLKDTRDWKIINAINVIKNKLGNIEKIAYRPFDFQYTFYSTKSKSFLAYPRFETMQHFLSGENLGLTFVKFGKGSDHTSAFINNGLVERCQLVGHSSGCYITPLYLYDINGKTPNFTPEFLAYKTKHKILKDKNEEQILAFIYANLYNPKYRSKYLEYLKIGFPKVSFEVSVKEFERFEKLGSELIKLHLMQEIPQDEIDFIFLKESKKPNFKIAKYQEKERFVENKIILNEDLAISPISAEIWNYTIGGYQVLKQWLKYRKDYACTKEELEHLLKICKILKKTIEIQGKLSEI